MATDITFLSLDELQRDLDECLVDAETCRKALTMGIMEYSGHSVNDRLNSNEWMINIITIELRRRGAVI